jgi:hypothetical protein
VVSRASPADEDELCTVTFVRDVFLQDPNVIRINAAREAAIRKLPAYRGTNEDVFRMWLEGLWTNHHGWYRPLYIWSLPF